MIEEKVSLAISVEWWQEYHDMLRHTVAALTDEQLELRLRPELRSVVEITAHIVLARALYLHGVMDEGDAEMESFIYWGRPDKRPQSVAELLRGLDLTWQLLTTCLARWTAAEMSDTFFINWLGAEVQRSWIVWHILEHELHHGGELSFTLGGNGLLALDI